VVNFDFPASIENYAHRVGRTGRQGQNGTAFSFFTREDIRLAPRLVNVLKEHKQNVDSNLESLASLAEEHMGQDASVKENAEEQRRNAYNKDFSGGEEEDEVEVEGEAMDQKKGASGGDERGEEGEEDEDDMDSYDSDAPAEIDPWSIE